MTIFGSSPNRPIHGEPRCASRTRPLAKRSFPGAPGMTMSATGSVLGRVGCRMANMTALEHQQEHHEEPRDRRCPARRKVSPQPSKVLMSLSVLRRAQAIQAHDHAMPMTSLWTADPEHFNPGPGAARLANCPLRAGCRRLLVKAFDSIASNAMDCAIFANVLCRRFGVDRHRIGATGLEMAEGPLLRPVNHPRRKGGGAACDITTGKSGYTATWGEMSPSSHQVSNHG